ncbi:hypothetical protein B0H65DRAFT_544998 [Neurospora tetraspora]|uniref:Ketoreductase domain-containing protein n=1 Tax=Neurospora tetraspora TaxID=94610 RepID=A0AAE0JQD4_9PEZI|nr:hypothetical protein B0H65DRAFT_544998 [Neurospora tetraspora]
MNPSTTITARLLTRTGSISATRTIITASKLEAQPTVAKPPPPAPKDNETKPQNENSGFKRFSQFGLTGKVFIVTGGAQGLGLEMTEALAEAGAKVYCLDRAEQPDPATWSSALKRVPTSHGGSLHYREQDVQDTSHLDKLIASIATENNRLDGVVATAGVQQLTPAMEYKPHDVARMLAINYTGVFMTASSAARQMYKLKTSGSIVLIASMSGLLARNLAMEWSRKQEDGTGGIRVNCISPGHILTPMVRKNFEEVPGLREKWEAENMMGRLAETKEFRGAVQFLASEASSFMTGGNLVIDGGHTACLVPDFTEEAYNFGVPGAIYDMTVFGGTCSFYATNHGASEGQEVGYLVCDKYYEAVCTFGKAVTCNTKLLATLVMREIAYCVWP